MKNSFYRWYDEPDFIIINLENNYFQNLLKRAIKKANTIENLSKTTGISKASIHNHKNGKGLRMKNLKLILDFLNINYDRINQKIEKIGWNQTKTSIKLNSNEIAIVLAASLADGHISDSHFMYKNKNPELINRVKNCIRHSFGDVKILDRVDKNGTNYILSPSFVKRQLERLDSPRGKKLFKNPGIPDIIKKGTLTQKKLFIQQFFDDEGWPETENRKVACSQSTDTTKNLSKELINNLKTQKNYTINKIPKEIVPKIIIPRILINIKEILQKDYNITTTLSFKKITKYKRKDKEYVSASWELNIYKKEDIRKFHKKIGFFSSSKQEILSEIIKEKPIPNNIKQELLNLAIKFQKEKGFFKVKDIQKELNLERGRIRKRLNTLTKDNILENNKGNYSLKLNI